MYTPQKSTHIINIALSCAKYTVYVVYLAVILIWRFGES